MKFDQFEKKGFFWEIMYHSNITKQYTMLFTTNIPQNFFNPVIFFDSRGF